MQLDSSVFRVSASRYLCWLAHAVFLVGYCQSTHADLIVNAPSAITGRVTVQPIIVSNTDGSNTATFLGTLAQEAGIKQSIDLIWGQAGIDVDWLAPNIWNDSFANVGNVAAPGTRPTSDFGQVLSDGQTAGVNGPVNLLSMYFIRVVPGFLVAGDPFGVEGLAQVGGAGSTIRIGDSIPGAVLMGDPLGEQLAAKVIAHEIGHNLGLLHIGDAENLMLATDPTPPQNGINARLNSGQILTARAASQFVTAVPEPSISFFLLMAGLSLTRSRTRSSR